MTSVRGRPSVWLRALRPRQWTKNAILLAPLVFAREALDPHALLRSLLAAAAFCLLASGIYVLNDWLDREKDRLHPEKRKRPIAAGELSGRGAFVLMGAVWVLGFALSASLGLRFLGVATGYVVLQLLYSWSLKHHVLVDVMVIAFGFVLRVIAGGVAISVPVSNWLFLCTVLLALFLGFGKRRHEVASLQGDAALHRTNLSDYSLPMLDQMIAVVAASCIVAYGLYTVSPETVERVGSDRLKLTVPFVIYGILRYLFLIHKRGMGGSPERVLLSDKPFLVNVLLYLAVTGLVLYRG